MKNNNLLKRLREAKGFTQEEVADRLEVTTNTIQNWEREFRFKRPEDLHSLLDLYGVADVTRNSIVLDVYGRKFGDNCAVMTEKVPGCNVLQEVMDEIAGEKDVQYYFPYPLDKLCTCLDVVDNRMSCLETAISYLEGCCFGKRVGLISGWQTAFIIDSIGREYNAEAGAAEVNRIQENNEKVRDAFPLGDEEGWTIYSEEFGEYIDPIAHEKQFLGELKDIRKVADSFDLVMFPVDGRIGNGYTLGARQFIERFVVGLFVPMHFVASGFESAWRMKEYTDAKNIPFWGISREGETREIQ